MIDKAPKISVIIPTKNRFDDLIKCIESISIQTLLPDEIVIVDSSDTTELKSKLELAHNKITFRYIHALLSLTQARNVGIKESTGDIIIFLDDDVILDKDYIKEIMHIFNNDLEKKIGGVTGNIMDKPKIKNRSFKHLIGSNIMHTLAAIFFLFKSGDGKFQPSGWPTFAHSDKITKIECLSGANMAFRREIFNELNFDENLHGYSFMEDDDIAIRVSRKYQNMYTPFAKLVHNVSPVARDKEYTRMKMTIENHYYLFKKNFPQDFKHKFAFWWSVVGLLVVAMINRNREGLKGLKDGVIDIRRNKNGVRGGELNMSRYHLIQKVMPQTIRDKIPESVKQRIRKLFSLSNIKTRYEFFKSVSPQKMDEDLLRTFIMHYAHLLDKITKTRWVEGKCVYYDDKLTEATKVWHEKNFDVSDDLLWAEQILKQYYKWEKEKEPIRSINRAEEKKNGDIYKIIKQRRSIRYFEKMDIEKEKLMKVLEAGRWAPCSGNRQAWKFIVQRRIKGAYIAKQELSFEREEWRAGSVIIYVAIDERLYPEKYTAAMDAAAAMQNMLLMAHNLELGGCWMYISELTNQNNLRKKLGLYDYYYIYAAVLLGYPAEHPEPPLRKPLEKCVKLIGFSDDNNA